MIHAQSDYNAHRACILKGESFQTYGNLWGSVGTHYPGLVGHLGGAALRQIQSDAAALTIDYVLWSYTTPIAWRTVEQGWRIDSHRYGAASDKALSAVRSAILGGWQGAWLTDRYLELRTRHHMSYSQQELLWLTYGFGGLGYVPTGHQKLSMAVLARRGFVVPVEDAFVATDEGWKTLTGKGIERVVSHD